VGLKRVLNPCTALKATGILVPMLLVESDAQAARQQLERVLLSPGFARNERLSRFLRFVVERHLEGRDHELKESVIAIEVFGRRPDYNPKHDAIVRTEAGRLRARLSEFYIGEGKNDPLIIELPKGRYMPAFRRVEAGTPTTQHVRKTPSRVWLLGALGGLAVALGVMGWWKVQSAGTPISIAVLPLENLSNDPAHDYFADGLTDEIIRNLSIIDGLAVRSQTSSFAFKSKPRSARKAGQELNVDYILEGSVLRVGERLRIDAQLIRVRDDVSLWSGRFDRELTDIFAIQDEISRGIVNSLRLKLGGGRRRYETSAEAYDLYLQARALGIQSFAGEERSVAPFEAAIAKDPSFAPAYAGLASAHVARSGTGGFDVADEMTKMQTAAERAIQLDPLLGEAHSAMGVVYAREAQWAQSEKSFRHALELAPNDSVIYDNFAGTLLMPLGRIQEAVQLMRKAEKNDPVAPRVHQILANALIAAGRYDEAAEQCMKLPADFPTRSTWLARARLGQGRIQEAIQILVDRIEQGAADPNTKGYLGYAYGRAGRRDEAEKLAAADQPLFQQALTFAGLGDKDRTLDALERMTRFGPVRLGRDLTYPEFDLVRGDSRLKALRKKLGLPE
jgi:TolB-like protein/Flp pilus assembly protein TadD